MIMAALVWKHTGAPSHALEEPLVIAYGDDIAGIILQKALADLPAERADIGLDAINMGDCCGSNAQFALSTGQVDVAVLVLGKTESFTEATSGGSVPGAAE